MPVADFAGRRNWGYDGVALFAPSRAYGRPDDLRALRRRRARTRPRGAARRRLQPSRARGRVPAGVQPALSSPTSTRRRGAARSISTTQGSDMVRRFLIDNALHWIHEYHVDGLRLDATHALFDDESARTSSRSCRRAVHARRRSAAAGARRGPSQPRDDDRALVDAAAGDSTASGPTTSTTSSARMLAGDAPRLLRRLRGDGGRAGDDAAPGLALHRPAVEHRRAPRGTDPSRVPMRASVVCSRITIRSATARSAIGCTTRSIPRPGAPRSRCC